MPVVKFEKIIFRVTLGGTPKFRTRRGGGVGGAKNSHLVEFEFGHCIFPLLEVIEEKKILRPPQPVVQVPPYFAPIGQYCEKMGTQKPHIGA